jgi:hypothetical protein
MKNSAGAFPSSLPFGDLRGLGIKSSNPGDILGGSTGTRIIGDINNDGKPDIVSCAINALGRLGQCYIDFGYINTSLEPNQVDAYNLTSTNGTVITGLSPNDRLGFAATGGFDFNKDGKLDWAISSIYARNSAGGTLAGATYVFFGNETLPTEFNITSINGKNGVIIEGSAGDFSGFSLTGVRNVNGNDVLVIGSPIAGNNDGKCWMVSGTQNTYPAKISLSSTTSSNGTIFLGSNQVQACYTVTNAEGFYGSGTSAILIGGFGEAYVIRLDNGPLSFISYLNSVDGSNGTIFQGMPDQGTGSAVACGNIFTQINSSACMIGEPGITTGSSSGTAYYLPYNPQGWGAKVNLTIHPKVTTFIGATPGDNWGNSVAVLDLNGDDALDAGLCSFTFQSSIGGCIFSFGNTTKYPNGFPSKIYLDNYNNSVLFFGPSSNAQCGIVNGNGMDITGDGVPDIIGSCPGTNSNAGEIWVQPGRNAAAPSTSPTPSITATPTPTGTPTSSITPTASITPSRTPSNTPSQTASQTSTPTPTPSSIINGLKNQVNELFKQQEEANANTALIRNIVLGVSIIGAAFTLGRIINSARTGIKEYKRTHPATATTYHAIGAFFVGIYHTATAICKGLFNCFTCYRYSKSAAGALHKHDDAGDVELAAGGTTHSFSNPLSAAGVKADSEKVMTQLRDATTAAFEALRQLREETAKSLVHRSAHDGDSARSSMTPVTSRTAARVLPGSAVAIIASGLPSGVKSFIFGSEEENNNIEDEIDADTCPESEGFDEFGNPLYLPNEIDQPDASTKSVPSEGDAKEDKEREESPEQSKKVEDDAKAGKNEELAKQLEEAGEENDNPKENSNKATQPTDKLNTQAEEENMQNAASNSAPKINQQADKESTKSIEISELPNPEAEEISVVECLGECAASA